MSRYIDAFKLKKRLHEIYETHQRSITINRMLKIIDEQPTVEQQTVRLGKWIKQLDGTHYCDFCGRDATYSFDGTEICGVACTYCGTKMDEVINS